MIIIDYNKNKPAVTVSLVLNDNKRNTKYRCTRHYVITYVHSSSVKKEFDDFDDFNTRNASHVIAIQFDNLCVLCINYSLIAIQQPHLGLLNQSGAAELEGFVGAQTPTSERRKKDKRILQTAIISKAK